MDGEELHDILRLEKGNTCEDGSEAEDGTETGDGADTEFWTEDGVVGGVSFDLALNKSKGGFLFVGVEAADLSELGLRLSLL